MAFPKFHGISLAANSWIENAHFERLAADPVPVAAGRIWFNTTEKALKYSSLDAVGAVIVRAIGDETELQAAIDSVQAALTAEVARAQAAEATLTSNLAAEVTRAQAAEATLTANLATEVGRAQAAEGVLSSDLAAEIARAIAAEAGLQTAINTEKARAEAAEAAETAARIAADSAVASAASDQLNTETQARLAGDAAINTRVDGVQAELDASQSGAGLNVDGTYTAPENTSYLGTATSLKNADVKLDAALTAEVGRAQAAEAALASAIANEAQLRTDGDAALQAQIQEWVQTQIALDNTTDEARVAAEAALRIAKDDALQSELDRTQAAIGLDTDGNLIPITGTNYLNGATSVFAGAYALDTQLKIVTDGLAAEEAARQTADSNFLTQLNAETARATAAEVALQQELNGTQAGAGLEANGSYAQPTGSNYINGATSLKDADYVLDAAVKTVSDAVATEVAARQSAVSAEAAARQAADSALDSRVTTVEGQVNGKIGDLTTLTTTVKDTIVGAVNEVDADLAAEVVRATAAEAALNTALTNEVSRAQSAEATLTSNLNAEVTRAQGAEASLQTAITAEATRAQGVEATLQTAINTETAERIAAVSAEASRAQAAEATLTSNLAAEVSRAQGAEGTLQASIDTLTGNLAAEVSRAQTAEGAEATARQAADAQLTSDLAAEVAARAAAVTALKAALNGKKYAVVTASAALSHVISHGLNSENVNFSILVEGADGKFRNDIVAVEEIDFNSFRVDLTEARRIKVSVQAMTDLV
jgi:hypothetical protein